MEVVNETEQQRTLRQNRALYKFFEILAITLNDAGLDMRKVLKPEVEIPWTPISVKTHLWHPLQKIMLEKSSTADLTTKQISEIYEVLNRHLATTRGISVPFPTDVPPMI